jgi:hypothetical protein
VRGSVNPSHLDPLPSEAVDLYADMMERLFGFETEYGFTTLDPHGEVVDGGQALMRMMQIAQQRLPHLPDGTASGVFLANGARLYAEWGHHPEFATPECATPWDAVRYLHAGERLLTELAAELEKDPGIGETMLLRSNVDYGGTDATWGTHESYMYRNRRPDLARQVIPHLVSRVVYTGAGGFNSLSPSGLRFTLSPRVWHLEREVSDESTHDRGIFHTKNEALAGGGYNRMHVICGESVCSEIANWLRIGATALVVALVDGGESPGDAVALRTSLNAMRAFARDPTCRATAALRSGSMATAIAIQRHYLDCAEANLGQSYMPPFAAAVCEKWRAMLDQLEGAPASVATTLDWGIKYALFVEQARRWGMDWDVIESWSQVAEKLAGVLGRGPFLLANVPQELILGANSPALRLAKRLTHFLRVRGLAWDGLNPFLRFRNELCALDARFGQLGKGGIFAALDAAGALDHRVPGVDDIEHAMDNPPAVGRPQLRGQLVRSLAGDGKRYVCDWNAIWDGTEDRFLSMNDPFSPPLVWTGSGEHKQRVPSRPSSYESVVTRVRRAEELRRQRPVP